MVQKVIRDRLDAILHWNISLVGGFLGAYAILLHAGNFGSAQTGNLMEMGAELVSMEWFNVLLRLAALVLFGLGVASAYLLTNFTKINMRKLALWVDAAALALASMLPLEPALVGIYPIFFASAFQWGVYSGADGFNSATIFMTNNFKQSVLGWLQYGLTKDKEFKRKAILLYLYGHQLFPGRGTRSVGGRSVRHLQRLCRLSAIGGCENLYRGRYGSA